MFRTGEKVKESGIYQVVHSEHRLPHEVTLLKGSEFPRCSKCKERVIFEPIALVPELDDKRERIVLYELPDLDPETNVA